MKTMLVQLMAVVCLIAIAKNTCYAQDIPDIEETVVNSCVVSDVSGKVTYKENGSGTEMPVKTGTVLREDATVMVSKKSSITLANSDRSLSVDKKGSYQMSSLIQEVKEKGEVSRFAQMAFAAKGYGTTPPDTTKKARGWGDRDSILFNFPFRGNIPLQTITLNWTPLKEGSIYKLVIFQSTKDSPILSVTTSTASYTCDAAQLAVKPGQIYHSQVVLVGEKNTTSAVTNFTFVSADQYEITLVSLKKEKEYLKSNAVQKILMEATEFEAHEFYSLANECYQKAIKMDANNSMPKQIYVAFLDRINK